MRRILVTAISGNVSNGILKTLQETEDEIFGCDIYDFPVGMDKVKVYWKSELAVTSGYINSLIEKCEEYQISHLIPANEVEIEVINRNINRFHSKGIRVLINKPQIIDCFLDKYKTYQSLKNINGIFVPETFRYCDFIADGRQYIVKLNRSCGSKYFKLITTKEEIDSLDICPDEYIIQEYLPDAQEEYTVGVFSDGENVYTIIFKRKLEHGYTSFVELVYDESISESARLIAQEIGLRGYINIQLRKQGGKNFIFEINPRISGTVYFRHLLEFKDVLWWLDMIDGREIAYAPKYKKAVGMRELTEKFVMLE